MTQRTVPFIAALAATALSLPASPPAAAQGWIDPPGPSSDWGIVKLRTDVVVRVEGRVAQVEVEEWFENRGRAAGEGVYLYPLPGEAVFSDFSLYQGDQELRGETMDGDRARAIYEEIVRNRRDPALIELVGHGLIRARVFPIEPGQSRKITLRYTQLLDRAGDALQFHYLAGRPVLRTHTMPRIPRPMPLQPPTEPSRSPVELTRPPLSFTLIADAAEFGQPFSPTHAVRVDRRAGELRVTPAGHLAGEFSVFLPLASPRVGLTLATHRPSAEPGYFMLTLSPGMARSGVTPRDITVVVDVSGSMAGQKMEQTRQALHQLLGSLAGEDRFRLVAFSSEVSTSSDGWTGTGRAELETAGRWVDQLRAQGGTNIAGALEEAFRLPSPGSRLPIVVFLTDGLPTVGERDPEPIAAMAEARRGAARVFAFGVGYDVNTYLLDRLSVAGRGSTAYVQPGQDVELAVGALAAKITHPVLTDLEILGAPVRLTEVHPSPLPDLFAGEELVLFGRYDGQGDGALRMRGRRGDRPETFAITASFPGRGAANPYIPRLWAARKLGELSRMVRLHGPDPELTEEIRRTAIRYGLLSDHTAHLVQEPDVVADGIQLPGFTPQAATVDVRAAAAPPATGRVAVQAAESARRRREVSTSADLALSERMVGEAVARSGRRLVAGRLFEQRDHAWVQVPEPDDARLVEIRVYSSAYFTLLRAAPELREVVAELERVTVTGGRVALRFGDDGRESLTDAEAARLIAEFRER